MYTCKGLLWQSDNILVNEICHNLFWPFPYILNILLNSLGSRLLVFYLLSESMGYCLAIPDHQSHYIPKKAPVHYLHREAATAWSYPTSDEIRSRLHPAHQSHHTKKSSRSLSPTRGRLRPSSLGEPVIETIWWAGLIMQIMHSGSYPLDKCCRSTSVNLCTEPPRVLKRLSWQ